MSGIAYQSTNLQLHISTDFTANESEYLRKTLLNLLSENEAIAD